jgi:hypothetical protein
MSDQVEMVPKRGAGRLRVDLVHGTKDVLANVHGPKSRSRFRSAAMVGIGRNCPSLFLRLVGGLSQRLVLDSTQIALTA